MQYGICLLSIVPCRKDPASTSEMVTQLLFGEHYTVNELTDDWVKITTAYDSYECWISIKQHHRISESLFNQLQNQKQVYAADLIHVLADKTQNSSFPVTIGATLPFFNGNGFSFDDLSFGFDGQVISSDNKKSSSDILSTAYLFLNAPYLWGGKSPFGIDCSGFTQLVYKLNGYKLPRDAAQQVDLGTPLNFVEEAEAGDLAFFDNEEGRIVHVGIIIDNEHIIHASGKVRIDKFDHYGIFNVDKKKYSHMLRVIKRLI